MADEPSTESKLKAEDGVPKESKGGNGPIPYDRFKEVNDQLAAYKAIGSTEEISQLIDDYAAVIAATQKQEPVSKELAKEAKLTPEKRAAILEQLEEVLPGISKFSELTNTTKALEQKDAAEVTANIERMQREATDTVVRLLDESGFDTTDKDFVAVVADAVANRIYGNKTLTAELFSKKNLGVVKQVFEQIKEKFLIKHVAAKPRVKIPRIPGMLRSSDGKPSTEKVTETISPEKLKGMSHQQQMKALGNAAFDIYEQFANERETTRAAGLLEE